MLAEALGVLEADDIKDRIILVSATIHKKTAGTRVKNRQVYRQVYGLNREEVIDIGVRL